MRSLAVILLLSGTAGLTLTCAAEPTSWPQFRWPDGTAVAAEGRVYPTKIGPDQNFLWKTAVPPGHSSPVIWGDRVLMAACMSGTPPSAGRSPATAGTRRW